MSEVFAPNHFVVQVILPFLEAQFVNDEFTYLNDDHVILEVRIY